VTTPCLACMFCHNAIPVSQFNGIIKECKNGVSEVHTRYTARSRFCASVQQCHAISATQILNLDPTLDPSWTNYLSFVLLRIPPPRVELSRQRFWPGTRLGHSASDRWQDSIGDDECGPFLWGPTQKYSYRGGGLENRRSGTLIRQRSGATTV
jgi:hypothetical protein